MARSMKVAMLACLFALSMTGTLSTAAAASDAPVLAGPEVDTKGELVLLSAAPQGCLEKLVGAQRAPCFYRQQWYYYHSQSQVSAIEGGYVLTSQATVTGYGEPGSACPASGVSLGSMQEVITTYTEVDSLDSYFERTGTFRGFNATQKCTFDSFEVCDMTLYSRCVLKYTTTLYGAQVDEISNSTSAVLANGTDAEPIVQAPAIVTDPSTNSSANRTNIISGPAPPRSASSLPLPGLLVVLLVILVSMSIAV